MKFRLCYQGFVDYNSPYIRGGSELCDGLCVVYSYYANQSHVYGCAPRETRQLLGVSSDNSCVSSAGLFTCFCTGNLCNAPDTLYPKPSGNVSCYSGYSYGSRKQFYVHEIFVL